MLPKDEVNHAVGETILQSRKQRFTLFLVCIGVIEDDAGLDADDIEEEDTIGFTPVYLFIWKTKFSLLIRARQLLCETYQGIEASKLISYPLT